MRKKLMKDFAKVVGLIPQTLELAQKWCEKKRASMHMTYEGKHNYVWITRSLELMSDIDHKSLPTAIMQAIIAASRCEG